MSSLAWILPLAVAVLAVVVAYRCNQGFKPGPTLAAVFLAPFYLLYKVIEPGCQIVGPDGDVSTRSAWDLTFPRDPAAPPPDKGGA